MAFPNKFLSVEEPEQGRLLTITTEHPVMILKATWDGRRFTVIDHWAHKYLQPDRVLLWSYAENSLIAK